MHSETYLPDHCMATFHYPKLGQPHFEFLRKKDFLQSPFKVCCLVAFAPDAVFDSEVML